ncbi:MAG: ABC transporter ATP-binding protein [Bacteroidota bacterium]
MPDALHLQAVAKRYGSGPFIFRDLTHTFMPGTTTGLVGPNGSGKTTLLRLLSAEAFPTSGRVALGSLEVHTAPYQYLQQVGIVHDGAQLPAYLSATEVLEMILRARGQWDGKRSPMDIDALLDALLLDERREQLIGTYSSGMFKKAQMAAALIADPQVLLLDEPFRGLDTDSTAAALAYLAEFKQRGGITILSSHLQPSLQALTDDLIRFPIATEDA